MKIQKNVISELEMVYSVSTNKINEEIYFMAATEGHGKCLLFSPPDWKETPIWEGPGGTMSLVPIPEQNGSFLATQEVFPNFQSENANIVYVKPGETIYEPWKVKKILDLPFVHRIDIFKKGGSSYVIACTLCGGKDNQDDWSKPGSVFLGKICEIPDISLSIRPILEGISKNHGIHLTKLHKKQVCLISGTEGVFMLRVPRNPEGPWSHQCLIAHEVSDIYVSDIDEDGDDEIITIESFHGNKIVIYKFIQGKWKSVREENIQFGHVLWGGKILGIQCLIVGGRAGDKELAFLYPQKDIRRPMKRVIIDRNIGPTSLVVVHENNYDILLSANYGAGEVALYKILS